ncbi:MAG: Holliday junction branch migration protein RuvA [Rhodospirillales bacterium]|jgi:Holliday junction DNA helicase RuvA|nr:Holliday junction branch migration protein RuvA [Rhodospirillales bacterium]
MIAKLTGTIDSLGDGALVIDVRGVGYLVACSQRTLARLAAGEPASLLIETQVREDAISLFGFADTDEREWFRRLVTVQGVGARAAMAILSAVPAEALASAIAAGDRAMITRAPGVGIKLATRIVAELRDAAVTVPRGAAGRPVAAGGGTAAPLGEAVSALVNLGFGPGEALDAVTAARETLGEAAGVEALISASLAGLAPKEQRA